jgi:signal transduction histidine kinase
MKQNLVSFSKRYGLALKRHLKPGCSTRLSSALHLGRQAVVLGMETLELARMHEAALLALRPSGHPKSAQKRAESFFTKANIPLEETHRTARQTHARLQRLKETLGLRTEELASTNRRLQRGVIRRKDMENAFTQRGRHHRKCLKESLELQKRLRRLAHQVLETQENERKKISRELRDEIAQTLLGINVRLLSLQREALNSTKGLKDEISSTQRLVRNSVKSVRRVAREFRAS